MKEINFSVTINEANLILESLGQMPFAKVFALVAKIQEQAQHQLSQEELPGTVTDAEKPGPAIVN